MTLAPEVARDDMREQIRKKIKNSDLIEVVVSPSKMDSKASSCISCAVYQAKDL